VNKGTTSNKVLPFLKAECCSKRTEFLMRGKVAVYFLVRSLLTNNLGREANATASGFLTKRGAFICTR